MEPRVAFLDEMTDDFLRAAPFFLSQSGHFNAFDGRVANDPAAKSREAAPGIEYDLVSLDSQGFHLSAEEALAFSVDWDDWRQNVKQVFESVRVHGLQDCLRVS